MRVRRWGLTKNLGGAGIDGRGGGRHGREKRVFDMEAPSIGSTPIRSAPQRFPQRCKGTSMGQLIHAVNYNCNSPAVLHEAYEACGTVAYAAKYGPGPRRCKRIGPGFRSMGVWWSIQSWAPCTMSTGLKSRQRDNMFADHSRVGPKLITLWPCDSVSTTR